MRNVLIFESDHQFANVLQAELSSRSCDVSIVEDATVGLQQAANSPPDLILLCTELPRMNGFSVCNRLKRDPKLQDVPVIIMSANASEETFQQHRNLPKKRADDYVHKPISFDELLPRIQRLMPLDGATPEGNQGAQSANDDLVLEDDIELEDVDDLVDDLVVAEEVEEHGAELDQEVAKMEAEGGADVSVVDDNDDDFGDFAEEAFEAVIEEQQAPEAPVPVAPPPRAQSQPPRLSSAPPKTAANSSNLDRQAASLAVELTAANERIAELEAELSRVRHADERLHQELDEARARLASGASGVKAKDILDLREALNKKDKEILDLRDQLTRRDKDMLASKDASLDLERANADMAEKLVDLDKQMHAAERAQHAAVQDREQANKRADEFKRKLDKTAEELGQTRTDLQAVTTERDQSKAAAATAQGESQKLVAERDELKAKLTTLEQSSRDELQAQTEARSKLEKKLAETEEQLDQSQAQAAEALEKLDRERSLVSGAADTISTALEKLRTVSQ
jgi:CheY-like chemotaxis protein/DNA repair exonuclease SbcCD ATPase subunit